MLQVMPLFFYIGGYGHLTAWRKARQQVSIWAFTGRRLQRLAVPSLALLGVWVVLGGVLERCSTSSGSVVRCYWW
ncbi:MAG: hypothetical protein R2713_20275 [Ilumatobacteraceae bacterium]